MIVIQISLIATAQQLSFSVILSPNYSKVYSRVRVWASGLDIHAQILAAQALSMLTMTAIGINVPNLSVFYSKFNFNIGIHLSID